MIIKYKGNDYRFREGFWYFIFHNEFHAEMLEFDKNTIIILNRKLREEKLKNILKDV